VILDEEKFIYIYKGCMRIEVVVEALLKNARGGK